MVIDGTEIEDTFAEAFRMMYVRLEVTARDDYWLQAGLDSVRGYGTSVIACDAEVGIETYFAPDQSMDGRCGAAIMMFGFTTEQLSRAVPQRVGQCLMTCPTVSVFSAANEPTVAKIDLGNYLRYFGDGFQMSKQLDGRRFWRIPVMDGEFLVEDCAGVCKGIAGGNFLIQSADQESGLAAARRATEAISRVPGVIAPFPGGVVRSGSKVGSKYTALKASTNESFCPTLRGRTQSRIFAGANCVYEIVIDGAGEQAISMAIREGIRAAAGPGTVAISAGNYGGKLGKFQFRLREILA